MTQWKMTKQTFLRFANSSWRMRFFLLWKLPAAWFMGIGVRFCDEQRCVVRQPYGWRSQNPFRSTYFAAQCAAAELSTGLLAMAALQGEVPVSMLVIQIEASFLKKADQQLLFTCEEGPLMQDVVRQAIETGEPQVFKACSVGTLPDGTEAARVWITWSFKRKKI